MYPLISVFCSPFAKARSSKLLVSNLIASPPIWQSLEPEFGAAAAVERVVEGSLTARINKSHDTVGTVAPLPLPP